MKILKDFGITALFGVLIICGSFALLGIAIWRDLITFDDVLPMIGAWVGAVVSAYFVVKAIKERGQ